MKSYVLFLLLGLCFFSCEYLKEIIKPTQPKPVADTCRIKTENGKEYIYDLEGKLSRINDYTFSAMDTLISYFDYNDQDQVIRLRKEGDNLPPSGADYPPRSYDYDSLARLKRIHFPLEGGYYITYTFAYKVDTILIDRETSVIEDTSVISTFQTVLCFNNDNLIRAYELQSETSQIIFDYTYTYTDTANKIRNQKKKLAFLLEDFTNPLMSKHLPASRSSAVGQDQGTITYTWQLNEQGYPINDGEDNQVVYTYECEE